MLAPRTLAFAQTEDDGVVRTLDEKEVMSMSRFKLKVELAKRIEAGTSYYV